MSLKVNCERIALVQAIFTPLPKRGINPTAEGQEQSISWPVQAFNLQRSITAGAYLHELRCLSTYTTQLGEQTFFPADINLYTKLSGYLTQRLVRVQLVLVLKSTGRLQSSRRQYMFRGILSSCVLANSLTTSGSSSVVVMTAQPYITSLGINRLAGDWYYGPNADSPGKRKTYAAQARQIQYLRAGMQYSPTNALWHEATNIGRSVAAEAAKAKTADGIHMLDFLDKIYTAVQKNYNAALKSNAPIDSIYNYVDKYPNTKFKPGSVKPGSGTHATINKCFIEGVGAQAVSTLLSGALTSVLTQWQQYPFMLLMLVPVPLSQSTGIQFVRLVPTKSPLGAPLDISTQVATYGITGIRTAASTNMVLRPDTFIVHMTPVSDTINKAMRNWHASKYGDYTGVYKASGASGSVQRRKNVNAPPWLSLYTSACLADKTAKSVQEATKLADQFAQMMFASAYLTQSTLMISGPVQVSATLDTPGIRIPFDDYIGKKVRFSVPDALYPINSQADNTTQYIGMVQAVQIQYIAGTIRQPSAFGYSAQIVLTQETGHTIQNTIYKTDQK